MRVKYGICICGLNGSGKTTLAKALSKKLGCVHLDIEDYYFTSSDDSYSDPRTSAEVEELLLEDIKRNSCFAFSSVRGNVNAEINSYYSLVIFLDAPTELRMKRILQRSVDKYGDRALPGGDMYEQEEKFIEFARNRTTSQIESWLNTLSCKVLRLDGTCPVSDNVKRILPEIEMPRKHNTDIVPTARMLRKNMTKEEKHLWYDFLSGHHVRFFRQKVLGKYIADFYCAKAKLVIELDGSGHYTEEGREYDCERTAFLEGYGLKVIRIPNIQIKRNFGGVCRYIDRVVEERLNEK